MPFKCGFTATAATFDGHNPPNSVDFQKGGIIGVPVLASAAETVSKVADEGGEVVPYFGRSRSPARTAAGVGGNPRTPEEVCGSGFSVIDRHALGKAGTVYLLYDARNGKNCVTTLKQSSLDKKTPASAFLEVKGAKRATDSGDFTYYAGPVSQKAATKCVKWGGSVGSEKFISPFEHCG